MKVTEFLSAIGILSMLGGIIIGAVCAVLLLLAKLVGAA